MLLWWQPSAFARPPHHAMMAALRLCRTPSPCYDGSPPLLQDPLTTTTQTLTLSYISMTPVIANTKSDPPDILRWWYTVGSFFPALFLQAPLLPLRAISRRTVQLPLFFSSFYSAHPCSWWPLEILTHQLCWFLWVLILKRKNMVTRSCWHVKKIYQELLPVKHFRDNLLCKHWV